MMQQLYAHMIHIVALVSSTKAMPLLYLTLQPIWPPRILEYHSVDSGFNQLYI
jgi:hypothetical protein